MLTINSDNSRMTHVSIAYIHSNLGVSIGKLNHLLIYVLPEKSVHNHVIHTWGNSSPHSSTATTIFAVVEDDSLQLTHVSANSIA